jgi:DNA modification methylase
MRSARWRLFGWYVWDKGHGLPGNWNGRLAPAHEFIFHFNRAARQANKWVPAQERRTTGTGLRKSDGSQSGISSPDKCGQAYKIPDSVLRFPPHMLRGVIENEHPAIFPIKLSNHLIRTFSGPGDRVCDPFMGSGTTGVSAIKLGRQFTGIELEPRYFEIACRRIEGALRQPDLFIARPAPARQEALGL